VVKEMLRRSSGCRLGRSHLASIFAATKGIVFFGTPHGGADPLGFLSSIVQTMARIAGFKPPKDVINSLLPSAERLRELRDEFGPLAVQQDWTIHSFQEQQGLKALGDAKVVDDTSSYLNLPAVEITEHIGRNHMDICRFSGPEDVEYKKVVRAIERIANAIRSHAITVTTPSTAEQQLEQPEERLQKLQEMLEFEQMHARHSTIKRAHFKTCKWFLKQADYVNVRLS